VIKTDQTKNPKIFTYILSQPPATTAVPLDHSGIVVGGCIGNRTRSVGLTPVDWTSTPHRCQFGTLLTLSHTLNSCLRQLILFTLGFEPKNCFSLWETALPFKLVNRICLSHYRTLTLVAGIEPACLVFT